MTSSSREQTLHLALSGLSLGVTVSSGIVRTPSCANPGSECLSLVGGRLQTLHLVGFVSKPYTIVRTPWF